MASTLSRNAHRFRNAHQLISVRSLTQCRSPFPSPPPPPAPPAVGNPTLTSPVPRSYYLPSCTRIQLAPTYHKLLFSTGSGSTNSETPTKADEAKSEGGDKTEGGESEEDKSRDSQQRKDSGKSSRVGPVSWLSFLLLVGTGAAILLYFDKQKKRRIEEINISSAAVKEGPSAGRPEIGGPFSLVNHEGKPVTEKDFKGKWTVLYFGYTHCPDICPEELQKLCIAVDKIKEKSGLEIVPVFISIDPARDTLELMNEYVKEFHPKLIGLTGKLEDTNKAARAFRIYYMKTEDEGDDYLVDHTIVMYLMNPKMEFVKYFGKNYDADTLTDGIIEEIKKYASKVK